MRCTQPSRNFAKEDKPRTRRFAKRSQTAHISSGAPLQRRQPPGSDRAPGVAREVFARLSHARHIRSPRLCRTARQYPRQHERRAVGAYDVRPPRRHCRAGRWANAERWAGRTPLLTAQTGTPSRSHGPGERQDRRRVAARRRAQVLVVRVPRPPQVRSGGLPPARAPVSWLSGRGCGSRPRRQGCGGDRFLGRACPEQQFPEHGSPAGERRLHNRGSQHVTLLAPLRGADPTLGRAGSGERVWNRRLEQVLHPSERLLHKGSNRGGVPSGRRFAAAWSAGRPTHRCGGAARGGRRQPSRRL